MKNLVEPSFGFPLRLLQSLGYYPSMDCRMRYHIYSYTVHFLCVLPITILAAVNLFEGDLSLDKISENAFSVFQVGSFIIKSLPFLSKSVRENIQMIQSPIFTSYSARQTIIMDECVKICNRNCWIFIISNVFTFITYNTAPLLKSELGLQVDIWFPMDIKANPMVFIVLYLIICYAAFVVSFVNSVVDPLLSGLLCHASYQFKIMKNNLEFLAEDARDEITEESRNATIDKKIGQCVEHHTAILRFVENFEQFYSVGCCTQLFCSIVVICISCLQLSVVEPFSYNFFNMICFLLTILIQIYLYCYYGTILFEESNTVVDAAYFGKWYDYDLRSRKTLLILVERSKRPVTVTVGKLLTLSLDTFVMILRRAYSLLAVLRNM